MPENKPKVLFIDWHKTLSYSFFWSQLSEKDHPYNNYHHIINQWLFEKNIHLIENWMKGLFNTEQICQKISTENNLNEQIIYNALKESSEKMKLCSPRIVDIIKNIRQQGISVIIATDNMDTFRKFTIKSLGLDKIFDDFLISNELGVLKYEVENNAIPFFDNFLKANNLRYEDVILLDDSEEKSGIYEKLGFKIYLVKNTEELINYLEKFTQIL